MTHRLIIIIGTGGGAHDVLDLLDAAPAEWQAAGFLDDGRPVGSRHLGLPVLGRLEDARSFSRHLFVNAIGSDASYRQRPGIIAGMGLPAERFATLVHPSATVSSRAVLGPGTCVHAGAVIAGGVVIGEQVGIGPGAIVGHDCVIGDYAMIAPGAIVSGFVRLGAGCYVGAGAALRQRVEIGRGALVGLGTVVLRDVPAGATVVGNPARVLALRQPGDPTGWTSDRAGPSEPDILPTPTMFPTGAERSHGH